jgi:ligand-binding sensor domain-containing protein
MDLAQPFEEQLAKLGDVEWKKEDSVEGHLTWYGLKDGVAVADAKRKVVSRFQGLDGREHVKINGIAFGTDYVWLATDDGLMAWNRQQAYWGRFAVAGTLLDVPVTEVSVAEGGKLRVTVVEEGAKPRRFEYDPNTVKWRELD